MLNPPPANNDCATAELLTESIAWVDSIGASTDGPMTQNYSRTGPETSCDFPLGDEQIHNDIWFDYLAECTGPVSAGLCGSDFNSKLAVYDDLTCPPASGPIACSDDDCGPELGVNAVVNFPAQRGEVYRIRVGGYREQTGTGLLSLSHTPPSSADLRHVASLIDCFTSPCGAPPCAPHALGRPCCTGMDFDGDADVDAADHAQFLNVFTGPPQ
jgi:hypothetical protein